ncbi:MAG TPA: NAD(P)H-dependent oxidoreductase subunit E [Myxococcales bacterium]|jgi:NADH-quinone oxidoreductase subunit E|nr:NAD(P)H-dependent oxidoreductase subunit E [Myxococcales bacterium]
MIALSKQAGVMPSPFDAEQQRRFDEGFEKAVAKYPPDRRRSALLAVLHLAQDELGWLPEPAMAYVGFRLDVPPVRVREVVTFYTMYRLHPVGRHHIGVCNSVSCWAMGSESILRHCEERLGIRPGQVTKDGQFSLEEVACLASCGTAPAALHNNFTYVENVTPESVDALIARLRTEPGQTMAPGPHPRHLEDKHAIEKQSQPQATGTVGQAAATTVPTDKR